MKRFIGLAVISLLLAACERNIGIVTFEFHQVAAVACEKNGGYQKFRVWSNEVISVDFNYHIVVMCNDGAEFYLKKTANLVNDVKTWGEWETDTERFGQW